MITVKALEEYNGSSSQMQEKQKNRPRYTEAGQRFSGKSRKTYLQVDAHADLQVNTHTDR